jgi:hypothetical protein
MTWTLGHIVALIFGSIMAGLLIFDDDKKDRRW